MKIHSIAFALIVNTATSATPVHSAADESGTFQLSNGVVVDLKSKEVYVMVPGGHVAAVSVANGSHIWSSTQTAKPLALTGNVLVSQQANPDRPNQFSVLALDTLTGGRQLFKRSVTLPDGVNATLGRTVDSIFVTHAVPTVQGTAVSWEYARLSHGGARPDGPESIVGTPKEASLPPSSTASTRGAPASAVTKGAFRIDVSSRKVTPLTASAVPPLSKGDTTWPSTQSETASTGSQQFRSADGRYSLTSEKVGNDATWDKYVWTIYDQSAHKIVGRLKSYLRVAPFFLVDSKIVYEDGPYRRRAESGEIVSAPRELRAVDLTTGAVAWTQPLQDVNRPGSLPP